jgi:AraC-like DNA-binding protein
MSLVRYMPDLALGEFVDYLYVDRSADSHSSLKEYVQPTHPIVTLNACATPEVLQQGKIKGVFTRALESPESVSQHAIGIRLKPYGLYTGFGIPGNLVANRIIPASGIFSETDLQHLAETLQSGDHQAAVTDLHQLLYDKLAPKALLYEITDMLDALVATDLSKNSQRDLAQAFERSPKSFIEVFRKAIGITPLNYLHIHKIDTAKRMLLEQPLLPLTEVGYVLGFYDQAHFIRVFKKHTGATPFQYKTALALRPVNSIQF